MLANTSFLQLIEIESEIITEFILEVELLNGNTSVFFSNIEDLSQTLRYHQFTARKDFLLNAHILNRTILLADLFKSVFGYLY